MDDLLESYLTESEKNIYKGKLHQELEAGYRSLIGSSHRSDVLENTAQILEVMRKLVELEGYNMYDMLEVAKRKRIKK